jgi:hypothetical protein
MGRLSTYDGLEEGIAKHKCLAPLEVIIRILNLGEEEKKYALGVAKANGIDISGKISLADAIKIHDKVLRNPQTLSELRGHQCRHLTTLITAAEHVLQGLAKGSDLFNQKKASIDEAKKRLEYLRQRPLKISP